MEDSRNIIKAIDALTLKVGGEVVNSKNITEAVDNLKAVYDQQAIGLDSTLTQEGLAADAKSAGDAITNLSIKPYGQYSGTNLTENSNLNDCTTTGRYICTRSIYATSANNYPEEKGGFLDVVSRGSDQIWQFYISFTPNIFFRLRYSISTGGSWTAWKKVQTV